MVFGQVVIGPPGSGKTTYCEGMRQYLQSLGRKVAVVNLDPANGEPPYPVAINIMDIVVLESAARLHALGPNGALIFCMEYLLRNKDWLLERLAALENAYVLFDLPGQVELCTHSSAMCELLQQLQRWQHRLTAVHLVDAHHCADASKFVSVLLVTLTTMVTLEMPQVNLLSKIDLIESLGDLAFNLDFYTDVLDPARILPYMEEQRQDSAFARKHLKLSAAICELVNDFGLVSFGALNIGDRDSLAAALRTIDKANGYCFGSTEGVGAGVFACAAGETLCDDERVGTVQERYMREDDLSELKPPGQRRDPR
tara:strand:+ start:475 stop:1410 length:936 start_codon:yes stop_codon:yes gene_type:complete